MAVGLGPHGPALRQKEREFVGLGLLLPTTAGNKLQEVILEDHTCTEGTSAKQSHKPNGTKKA